MSESKPICDRRQPSAKMLWLLSCAAEKRARGFGWPAVAEGLNRTMSAWQLWLRDYPATWDRLLRAAEARIFREAGAEALAIMRNLLRSESETIRRDVGRTLTVLMFREPRDNTGEIPCEDISQPEITRIVEGLLREVYDDKEPAIMPGEQTDQGGDAAPDPPNIHSNASPGFAP